ncbi:hypothetical protein [Arenicella chitinivorans]|uniref:hypothetical protein n=1 Tax=Arenicella chitinivorans TaxID=1329800 RepID=UPI0016732ABF|nr:hypothetical protein [Arenicella chitinivorans]
MQLPQSEHLSRRKRQLRRLKNFENYFQKVVDQQLELSRMQLPQREHLSRRKRQLRRLKNFENYFQKVVDQQLELSRMHIPSTGSAKPSNSAELHDKMLFKITLKSG